MFRFTKATAALGISLVLAGGTIAVGVAADAPAAPEARKITKVTTAPSPTGSVEAAKKITASPTGASWS
jgi:hypothetical protein